MKENLEQRMRDTLDADFPEWVWKLKSGESIAVFHYGGSWTQPGTRLWYEHIFVCISGNRVYYIGKDGHGIGYAISASSMKPISELAAIDAEIEAYRAAHPNWQNEGM